MTRRTNILVAVLMLAAVGVVGCESSSPSSPAPDTAPPAGVTGLQGIVTGDPSVSLSWTAGAELDLAGYHIYRRVIPTVPGPDDEMELFASVTGSSFEDNSVLVGASYVYGVTAYDASNNESPRMLTGEFDIPPPDSDPAPGSGTGVID